MMRSVDLLSSISNTLSCRIDAAGRSWLSDDDLA
jgi:hypothetical protein